MRIKKYRFGHRVPLSMQSKVKFKDLAATENALWIVEFLPKKTLSHCAVNAGNTAFQGKEAMMPVQTSETRASVVPFAMVPDPFTISHRQAIIQAAASHRIPTMYAYRVFVAEGGLMAYSADIPEQYRGAASYVDRIFKGANPGELPVQQPDKYQFVVNLKTGKALGLEFNPQLLSTADELIE
jgi:ABC-type uncharacterized transport system substrate-binding protein